jgi:hypothetical protein
MRPAAQQLLRHEVGELITLRGHELAGALFVGPPS